MKVIIWPLYLDLKPFYMVLQTGWRKTFFSHVQNSREVCKIVKIHIVPNTWIACRMLPVYLLLVGFAATWWSSLGSGPMWHYLVETESAVCRRKFWLMASFLQNLIDPKHICLVQTW